MAPTKSCVKCKTDPAPTKVWVVDKRDISRMTSSEIQNARMQHLIY